MLTHAKTLKETGKIHNCIENISDKCPPTVWYTVVSLNLFPVFLVESTEGTKDKNTLKAVSIQTTTMLRERKKK